MGLQPEYFGPYIWATIHLICLGAPSKLDEYQKQAFRIFFYQLPFIIPCGSCGKHLQENLKDNSIENALNKGNDALFKWSVNLHNIVNKQLNKQEISYEDAYDHWKKISEGKEEKVITKEQKNPNILFIICSLIIGILFGAIVIYAITCV